MKRIWITKEGHRLLTRRMETSHIVNCVRMIERCQEARILAIGATGSCLHGDTAIDTFEAMYDDLLENGFPEDGPMEQSLETFRAELLRRGHEVSDSHDVP